MTNAVTQGRAEFTVRFTAEEAMSKLVFMGVAAAFCIAGASPIMAAAPDPAGAPKAEATESSRTSATTDNTRYCVVDTLTGSHVRQKICRTRKEWLGQGFDPLAK